MSAPTAMLHMIQEASQSVQPHCQGGKLTGEWNGRHSTNSAWQERSAVFAAGWSVSSLVISINSAWQERSAVLTAGDRYHQTQGVALPELIVHALDSKPLDPEFHSYRSLLGHQNHFNMQATADVNGASFHPDVENYMVIEMSNTCGALKPEHRSSESWGGNAWNRFGWGICKRVLCVLA